MGMGTRTVSSESQNVRHVGHAMVIFDDRRVAPLFEVTLGEPLDIAALPASGFTYFNWSRWMDKISRMEKRFQLKPEEKPKRRVALMQQQVKQRTVISYL